MLVDVVRYAINFNANWGMIAVIGVILLSFLKNQSLEFVAHIASLANIE